MSTGTVAVTWSPFQAAIFDFVENGEGSCVVQAVAGSGKTRTLVEAARRIRSDESALFVAFNKRIQENLTSKLPSNVPALTFNSLGYRAWIRHLGGARPQVEMWKVNDLVRKAAKDYTPEFRENLVKLVGLAKGIGLAPESKVLQDKGIILKGLVFDDEGIWFDLMEEFDIHFPTDWRHDAVEIGRRLLTACILTSSEKIDFNDQLWLPVIHGVDFNQYDWIFVDEAQDCNAINLEIVERSLSRIGRVIACGDSFQGLYAFRGAAADAMPELTRRFDAISLPLSITYRCPRKVVELAREYVPAITAAEWAEEGIVGTKEKLTQNDVAPTDVILCRYNAPLVKAAFQLIHQGIGCRILGKDIGAGLSALVKKCTLAGMKRAEELVPRLETWQRNEIERLRSEHRENSIGTVLDKVGAVKIFIEQDPFGSISLLLTRIENMFGDEDKELVTLSTIHKSKGLEFDRVYILKTKGAWATGSQEKNCSYVAITRAKKELYFVG